MNKKPFMTLVLATLLSMSAALTACGGNGASNEKTTSVKAEAKQDPVTIHVLSSPNTNTDEMKAAIDAKLHEKYPYITVQYADRGPDQLAEALESGEKMDVFMSGKSVFPTIQTLALDKDMAALAKKDNFDLSRLDDKYLELVKLSSSKGELFALPYGIGFSVIYYNKDLFDKFAVPYPKDGMTWDETIELARRMTRLDGGVQYLGLSFQGQPTSFLANKLSLNRVNPQTGKADFENEGWRTAFQIASRLNAIPGLSGKLVGNHLSDFGKGSLAMLYANNAIRQFPKDLNWDMVTIPVFPDHPNLGQAPIGEFAMVTSNSEHPDAAFHYIETLFDKEVVDALAKIDSRPTPLKDKQSRDAFLHLYPDKNMQAIYRLDVAPPVPVTIDDSLGDKSVNNALDRVFKGETDINTALREASEEFNKALEAEKNK